MIVRIDVRWYDEIDKIIDTHYPTVENHARLRKGLLAECAVQKALKHLRFENVQWLVTKKSAGSYIPDLTADPGLMFDVKLLTPDARQVVVLERANEAIHIYAQRSSSSTLKIIGALLVPQPEMFYPPMVIPKHHRLRSNEAVRGWLIPTTRLMAIEHLAGFFYDK
jgi:hypothetical protein